eukprot:CAMPEP_0167749414 /NCGR_PEP_ID=MMETSP0110_2-20121227/5393_1 /TAXON_ID=629695 /ORGANISM="Gymnochlora sp., Strain CCMP2014" /LENGTH=211 /DNA_ID=CAMNT_0007634563 /DNA_START=771 /DNA_END=1406 /DNA_ORIENTATION=-
MEDYAKTLTEMEENKEDIMAIGEAEEKKFLEAKTLKLSEPNKFRCALCSKLFRGANYVHKHIRLKHKQSLDTEKIRAQEDACFKNYYTDPHKLLSLPENAPRTEKSNAQGRDRNRQRPSRDTSRRDRDRNRDRDRDYRRSDRDYDRDRDRRKSPPRRRRDRDYSPNPPKRRGSGNGGGGSGGIVVYDDLDAPPKEDIVVDYGFSMNLDDFD